MVSQKPVLVTLTSPTAAGKSYLFNYIRDVAKMPCLISTTTRAPRAGEKDGVDYYFIDEKTSQQLEANDLFAELAIYRGVRYGVTKEEFHSKLSKGVAFLIVEPSGIDHYVKPALDAGAIHLKYYIHTDPQIRLERFKQRVAADLRDAIIADENARRMGKFAGAADKTVASHMDRLVAMLTEELKWGTMYKWDRILFGEKEPAYNLDIIMSDVRKAQELDAEIRQHECNQSIVRSAALKV
jgi:guanylate kinase